MTPHQQIVSHHLNSWRNLKAWGRSLNNVEIEVSSREYPKRAGTCWVELQKIAVYHQPGLRGLVGMLKTGIHELAHAVETTDGHGYKWQERYAKATSEVTRTPVGWGSLDHTTVDEACYMALLKWWRTSGNEMAAKLLLGYK
jgi:hypothetical protein